MRLNQMQPRTGAKSAAKRVGRGIGSGHGKTCGRGHKGQKSRAGGFHKVGFEGGQMPLQRRLPKVGFRSALARQTAEIRVHELMQVVADPIDLAALKAARVVGKNITRVKVICSGTVDKKVTLVGISVTEGARSAIESAGGEIKEA